MPQPNAVCQVMGTALFFSLSFSLLNHDWGRGMERKKLLFRVGSHTGLVKLFKNFFVCLFIYFVANDALVMVKKKVFFCLAHSIFHPSPKGAVWWF